MVGFGIGGFGMTDTGEEAQSMHKQLDFPVYGKICTVGQLAKGSLCWNIKKNK